MGKLDPNSIIGILQGKLADLVFARMPNGTISVRHTPVRQAGFTPGELVTQSDFKRALAYVTRIKQHVEEYRVYRQAER